MSGGAPSPPTSEGPRTATPASAARAPTEIRRPWGRRSSGDRCRQRWRSCEELTEPSELDVATGCDDAHPVARSERDPAGENSGECRRARGFEHLLHPLGGEPDPAEDRRV